MQENSELGIESLRTGGKAIDLINSIDWSSTALGERTTWPQSLQSALSICINSNFPIAIYWGKELVLLYNDAWSPIPGSKHPWAMGKPAIEVWPEIWDDIDPQFKKAFNGMPGGSRDALLPMQRHGYTEECYFDFTFTPIHGESGKVEGIFNAVIETTYRVINERRSFLLQKLSDSVNSALDDHVVFEKVNAVLSHAKEDVPFYFIYQIDEQKKIKLKISSDHERHLQAMWPVDEVINGHTARITDLTPYLKAIPAGHWPEPPHEAVIVPLKANDGRIFGFLVGGVSSRRVLDKEYKNFYESIATIIGGELNTIRSIKSERKRAEALAQIDRAKTTFFNNISHEFRTPLTLMLSPLESVLASPESLTDNQKEDLTVIHRNALRLQKLVNSLLDFSRIEAGRMEANFEAVDLSRLTSDLANSFRDTIERAGITFDVNVDKIEDAYVDVDLWEKIVLNLVSNAFKYTERGRIEVLLKDTGSSVILSVKDTGIGINEEDKKRIFERFYRVNNLAGRSQEGTGIGLAMVRELVQLHQGQARVESEPEKGSVFFVTIPKRNSSVGENVVRREQGSALRSSFIEEVATWDQKENGQPLNLTAQKPSLPKILVADDNRDMREYIARLLTNHFNVFTASNGEDAFSLAIELQPDLIISDVMMPRLDGFGLLKKLRASFVARNTPIIFLSARAGEEAKVEGINAGANDYLVKPFSAKELFARVSNQIIIARTRRQSEQEFFNLFLQSPAHIHVMKGPEHIVEFFHPLGKKYLGRDITGMKIRDAIPEVTGQGYFEMLDAVYTEGKEFHLPETKGTMINDRGEPEDYYFNITYLPWKDVDGKIQGVLQFTFDVTEQAKTRKIIEEAEYNLQTAVDLADLGTWHVDLQTNFVKYSPRVAEWWGLSEDGDSLDAVIRCIHPADREAVSKAVDYAINVSGFYQADYCLVNAKTGKERYIVAYGKIFKNEKNTPIRLSGIVQDVTGERMAQAELERLVSERTSELKKLNEDLQRSNEELRQFTYVASHDLQEPLRKIQTFSEMAEGKLTNPELAKVYLEKIDSSAARMSALIRDVLAYSQVQHARFENDQVDLNEVIEYVKGDFELLFQERNVTLKSDRLPTIMGNKLQFQQLFQNLISNAIKFCETDPVITIRYKLDNADVPRHLIAFQDNGIGFDQQYALQIFQLFSRLHNRKDYAGTGIGLTLCKKIVENHGGEIQAYSEKGKGTRFDISLPVTEH